MPEPSEFHLHRGFYQWCVGWPDKNGNPTKPPALLPGVMCWHNSGNGKREKGGSLEGKWLSELGLTAGLHDLFFLRPTDFGQYGVFGLLYGMEWKRPGGALSRVQKAMHPRLMAAGMAASVVVDNLADARAWSALHKLTRSDP
jgi:hypothetical protein